MTRVQSKFAIINEMWSKNMIWYELKMILKGTLTASTASKVKKLRPLMGSEIQLSSCDHTTDIQAYHSSSYI